MIHRLLPLLAILTVYNSACTTTYVTPMAVTEPHRIDFTPDPSVPADRKSFVLPRDWQYSNWVLKKGAQISFFKNGFGEFSGRIFSLFSTSTDEIHFQSIQYGLDGNRLFSFPDNDTGYPMHVRNSHQDYPYNVKFAFDKRFFEDIHDVKFYARARLKSENVGQSDGRLTHSTSSTRLDLR